MKTKVNVRGSINALEVGQSVELPRATCTSTYVRGISSVLKSDTGKIFSVNATDKEVIVVTRLS